MEDQVAPTAQNNVVKELSLPIFQAKGWMKLVGVMAFLQGLLYAISLVGIIVAWLPIWLGVLLFQAAGAIEGAQFNGDRAHFIRSLEKIKLIFIITGVVTLVGIALLLLSFIFMGTAIFAILDEMGRSGGWGGI